MSRKVGELIARGERRRPVRVYLGRDRETLKRIYHNRPGYGKRTVTMQRCCADISARRSAEECWPPSRLLESKPHIR